MPTIELESRHQKALYWAANGHDSYGQIKVDAKVELNVQWEDVQEEALDVQGNTVVTDATVVVDREVPVGSVFWKGSLKEWSAMAEADRGEYRHVMRYSNIPDIKGIYFRQLVYLMRLSDELPELV